MCGRTRNGCAIMLGAAMLAMASHAAMAGCTPPEVARLHATFARGDALAARLRAGDCSVLGAYERLRALQGSMTREAKSDPNCWVKTYARPHFPKCDGRAATAAAAPSRKTKAPAPAAQQAAAPSNPAPGSASCSDITGTSSTAPSPADCKEANTYLHSARVIRAQYGLLAQEQYKEAAKSYRLAGDIAKAEAALAEAALSDEAFEAKQNSARADQPNPVREALLRSADTMLQSARQIDSRPATCSEFRDAAAFYFQAGRFLLEGGETKRADEIFLRRDFLINQVDRLEQEGRCKATVALAPALAPDDKCKDVADAVKYVRRVGGDLDKLNSLSTPACNVAEIKRAIFRECIRIYMDDAMDPSEKTRQAGEFGCPLAKH
jgi:hypothetical protein